ncbi:hypothetical protein [Achromobacter arsenitoxydans]|uniref:Uncharacterized protein n=1 Tax=Achromobacter arsenitoxydans SY8 TaxID=477184 RepID=H0FC31_9BURK|nr:hypothetical protein [Achromobacter arsenitoxydans]EHK64163.1 hypothetical protein KYC_21701 [Achromobacter arsenitoxydans SY8]
MATLHRNDRSALPSEITLVQGNELLLKVLGLGPNKKHLVFKGNQPSVLRVEAIRPDHRNREQSIKLISLATNSQQEKFVEVAAFVDEQPMIKIDPSTQRLRVKVVPGLKLPSEGTEAGLLARLLIAEAVSPDDERYAGQSDALESMMWIKRVLQNRLSAGAQHFSLKPASLNPKAIRNLVDVVRIPGQVAFFKNYPVLPSELTRRINRTLSIANDATDGRYQRYRLFVKAAIEVAQSTEAVADPCATGLYAWRTHLSASPGPNFVFFQTKGGQDFYTLTPAYRSEVLKIR